MAWRWWIQLQSCIRRSLRTRLFAIVLLGIALLTLVNVVANGWGLRQVRDQAINDSTQALQRQAESYLQRLAQDRASATAQTLGTIQQLVTATGRTVERITALPPEPNPPIIWQPLVDGRRYYHHGRLIEGTTSSPTPQSSPIRAALRCASATTAWASSRSRYMILASVFRTRTRRWYTKSSVRSSRL